MTTLAISPDLLLIENEKSISVLVDGNNVYTKECKDIKKCFSFPKKLKFSSNQNILFSLCYQSEGNPKFATLKSSEKKVQVCVKDKSVVELDEMMGQFKKR